MAGRGKETKGGLKQAAGKLLGNEQMEAEGTAEKHSGRTQRKTSGATKEASGTVKRGLGKLTGQKDVQVEGEAQRRAGRIERS